MRGKDRYRRVRRAIRRIKQLVEWADANLPNRAARRAFYYGDRVKAAYENLRNEKRKVTNG